MSAAISETAFDELRAIISTPDLPALGPDQRAGIKSSRQLHEEIDAWAERRELNSRTPALILSAALLWHDHLDEAHTIAQDIASADGSFLHGIMHRREPDYGNAKYWFHRVSRHAAFPVIAERVEKFLATRTLASGIKLVIGGTWQPMNFIDACEEIAGHPAADPDVKSLQEVQRLEFDALLEHVCTRR